MSVIPFKFNSGCYCSRMLKVIFNSFFFIRLTLNSNELSFFRFQSLYLILYFFNNLFFSFWKILQRNNFPSLCHKHCSLRGNFGSYRK